jgi:hypothetical protein
MIAPVPKQLMRRAVRFALHGFVAAMAIGLPVTAAWAQDSVPTSCATTRAASLPNITSKDISEALSFFEDEVNAGVTAQCLVCHKSGGAAPQAGARLVFGDDAQTNHEAFVGFLGPAEELDPDLDAEVIAFVERFYVLVLGRPSDQAGLDGWVGALTGRTMSGGDVAGAFFLSAEYSNRNTDDDEFVETVYRAFFNRDSDAGGKQGWLTALQQGNTRADVIDGFSGSAEFAALAASFGINATRLDSTGHKENGADTGTTDTIDGHWVLAKVIGQRDHGGGTVLTPASSLYQSLQTYLGLLGQLPGSGEEGVGFWRGTAAENREVTLRRASLLLSGSIPDASALCEAQQSEEGLREQVLAAMHGIGFQDFIIRNADDRLLVQGLLNGLDFNINVRDRYPDLAEMALSLPDERPEGYHEKPFLTSGDADREVTRAVSREPLELIAHIIMNDLPYSEVLTADYTMVNAFTDLAYRSGSGFQS